MTAPALPSAIAHALNGCLAAWTAYARGATVATSEQASAARAALEAAIAAALPAPVSPERCGLGEGTHFSACPCREAHFAALEAEVARLRNGLVIAESFVRTATAELKEARAVLAEIQWSGGYEPHCAGRCPSCEAEVEWDRTKTPAHAPGCRLAALLQGGR